MKNFDFELLRKSFTYNQYDGTLIRLSTGKPVIGLDAYGYIQLGYKKRMYKAHRIIWAIVYGVFPDGHVDHINGNRADNRLNNLRTATHQQNVHNRCKPAKTNQSGYLGVCWNKRASKWQAGIHVNGKSVYIGIFNTPQEAHEAYLNFKKVLHPSAPANLLAPSLGCRHRRRR